MNYNQRKEWFRRTGGVAFDSETFREDVKEIKRTIK